MVQKNIYAFSILKASHTAIRPETSMLISELLQIDMELSTGQGIVQNFSSRVFSAIDALRPDLKISRICLSLNYPMSHRLAVLSLHRSPEHPAGDVVDGYSCFVANQSSLFTLQSSNVRKYRAIQEIIQSYVESGKPVQRTITKLEQEGVISGVTLPLVVEPCYRGYLFLNSSSAGAFDGMEGDDFVLLCALGAVAKNAMMTYFYAKGRIEPKLYESLAPQESLSNVFDETVFSQLLQQLLKKNSTVAYEISLRSDVTEPFLLSSLGMIYLVSNILCQASQTQDPIQIDLLVKRSSDLNMIELLVSFSEQSCHLNFSLEESYQSLAELLGFGLKMDTKGFRVTQKFESAQLQGQGRPIDYST